MTLRERNLLYWLIGTAGVLVLGIAVYQWFWSPLQHANRQIEELWGEIGQKELVIRVVQQEQKRLERYKAYSLPSRPDQAASDYAKYLWPLLTGSGLTVDDLQPPPPGALKQTTTTGKKAGHMILPFTVRARGTVVEVIKALEDLRKAPVAHRVKSLALTPAEGGKDSGRLNVQMTVEALIVNRGNVAHPVLSSPDPRLVALESIAALRGAPAGMALGPWYAAKQSMQVTAAKEAKTSDRKYAQIGMRNPFIGLKLVPPPPVTAEVVDEYDMLSHVRLVHTSPSTNEGYFRNFIIRGRETKLQPKKGWDIFQVRSEDSERVLVKGKVLRIDQRDVYFQVGEDIYGIHLDQTLKNALKRPLDDDELKDLSLTSLYDENYAKQEMASKSKTPGKTPGKNDPKKGFPTRKFGK